MSDAPDFDPLWVKELLSDAETCARLTLWEEQFLDDVRGHFLTYGDRLILSAKQLEVLRRIEGKVYV